MTDHSTGDRWLEVDDVAGRLSVHPATVRDWCRKGIIPATRLPNGWRISETALDEWLAKGGMATTASR